MFVVMYDGLKSLPLTLALTLTLTLTLTMGAQLLFNGVAPQSVTLLGVPSVDTFCVAEHENSGDAERTGAL